MVAVAEYRIVLPFTVEEYKIAQLYMVAKYSASESAGDDGDGVEVLKNESFEDNDRRGQYTHKIYHLAGKLPGWLVGLMPKKALMLEEEAWNAYPHCTTVLKCPFFNKFQLILETTHLPDRGTTENALNLDSKTLKKRQVEFIDIAMDPVENYLEEEDPMTYRSKKTGRGPLQQGWQKNCEPVMCAYKCVTVDVPYWGFGSRLEKFIAKNAQRKILLEGHRKCFCWMDEWHGLAMEDVRQMEAETAEIMHRARAMALRKVQPENGSFNRGYDGSPEIEREASMEDRDHLVVSLAASLSKSSKELGTCSPRLMRRPSLVGPSVALGITTLSASDMEKDGFVTGSAPPLPSPEWKSGTFNHRVTSPPEAEPQGTLNHGVGSCESFTSLPSGSDLNNSSISSNSMQEETDMANCVVVLDRAIAWAKAKTQRSGTQGAHASGIAAPITSPLNGSQGQEENMIPKDEENSGKKGVKAVDHYVSVLDSAMSAVKWFPSPGRREP